MKCQQCTREITYDDLAASGYKRKDGSYGKLNICKDCNSVNAGFYKYLREGKSVDEYLDLYEMIVNKVYGGNIDLAHLPVKAKEAIKDRFGVNKLKPIDRSSKKSLKVFIDTLGTVPCSVKPTKQEFVDTFNLEARNNIDVKVMVKNFLATDMTEHDLINVFNKAAKVYGIADMLDKEGILKGHIENTLDSAVFDHLNDFMLELEDAVLGEVPTVLSFFGLDVNIKTFAVWNAINSEFKCTNFEIFAYIVDGLAKGKNV